jgi:hypothetical protein
MGQVYYPGQNFESKQAFKNGGNITVNDNLNNPYIIFKVGGVTYPSGFTVTYTGGFRRFYATVDSNRNIYITCYSIAYGQDIPAYDLNDVEIYVTGEILASAIPQAVSIYLNSPPYVFYQTNDGTQWYFYIIFMSVSYGSSYNIYYRQFNGSWVLGANVLTSGAGQYNSAIVPLDSYNPDYSIDIKIVSLGSDGLEYAASDPYTIPDYYGNTGGSYYNANFFWTDYYGVEGGGFSYASIKYAGNFIPADNIYSDETTSITYDGWIYHKGLQIRSANTFISYYIYRTRLQLGGGSVGGGSGDPGVGGGGNY